MIRSTMQRVPLSLNQLLERAGKLFPQSEIVSRLPDKSLVRHRFADFYRRSRALASALVAAGLKKGDRVATLCWNHYAHLECYFGIPAAGGVMHTLNLRLAPGEIAWIANHAQDRFLIVDDVLLPLYEQFKRGRAVREGDRRAAHRRAGPRPRARLRSVPRRRAGALRLRAARRRTTRSPCATPPAPPAGRRASSTRTARR